MYLIPIFVISMVGQRVEKAAVKLRQSLIDLYNKHSVYGNFIFFLIYYIYIFFDHLSKLLKVVITKFLIRSLKKHPKKLFFIIKILKRIYT